MYLTQGNAFPLGSHVVYDENSSPDAVTVNFAILARVPSITLLLFPPTSGQYVVRDVHSIHQFKARTGLVWHMCVHNIHPDTAYAFHVPNHPRFILPDPYGKWLESLPASFWMQLEGENLNAANLATTDNKQNVIKYLRSFPNLNTLGVSYPFRLTRFLAPPEARNFNWGDTRKPCIKHEHLVIYEAHIRALTEEGTFSAARKIIPYLKWLGISALQLMPIFEFSELEQGAHEGDFQLLSKPINRRNGNFWGYSPLSWFSPMNRYANKVAGGPEELKMLVKALHEAGIECFLDVVYNHTANAACPFHFLGVQKDYYMCEEGNGQVKHLNLSGCGNTLSPNSVMMIDLILQSLRWFVTEYRIDGFRLDAAGILCRDVQGKPTSNPTVVNYIADDPVLKDTKFIVEGWDAGDQIGSSNMLLGSEKGFPRGERFSEWNAEFRDAIRNFEKGVSNSARPFCKALRGSRHLFDKKSTSARELRANSLRPLGAGHGINFVACHDGFSLLDVVSYRKRVNRDGYKEVSFNCGTEGRTKDKVILSRRARHLRNFIFYLCISRGIPMITQGDELGFSKRGNSNSWNDRDSYAASFPPNPMSVDNQEHILQFTKAMLEVRRYFPHLHGLDFMESLVWLDAEGKPRVTKEVRKSECRTFECKTNGGLEHDCVMPAYTNCKTSSSMHELTGSDSSDSERNLVAFKLSNEKDDTKLFAAMNNTRKDVLITPPSDLHPSGWSMLIDTHSPPFIANLGPNGYVAIRNVGTEKKFLVRAQSCLLLLQRWPGFSK